MTMPWPTALPSPSANGYALQVGEETLRTDMEAGDARSRRRSFSVPDRLSLGWIFTAEQMAMFRAYWDSEISASAAWFSMLVDVGTARKLVQREIRFTKAYQAERLSAGYWQVKAEVDARKVPMSAVDHLNLFGLPSLDLNFAGTQSLTPVISSARQSRPVVSFSRSTIATYFGSDGLLKTAAINAPRFDYDPVSHVCKGLLIEGAATNVLWGTRVLGGATLATSSTTGPDGAPANQAVCPSGVASFPSVAQSANISMSLTSGQTIDIAFTSYFAAGVSGVTVEPRIIVGIGTSPGFTNALYAELQLNTSTMAVRAKNLPAQFTEVISPTIVLHPCGMYLVTWVVRFTANATSRDWWYSSIQMRDTAGSGTFTGDGVGNFKYAFPQAEIGSFPTSHIPTTSAAVTRAADVALMTALDFSSWFHQGAGTFFTEFMLSGLGSSSRWPGVYTVDDLTANNVLQLYVADASNDYLYANEVAAGVDQGSTGIGAAVAGQKIKAAHAFALNHCALSVAGALASDALATIPPVTRLQLGTSKTGDKLNGHLARLAFYPARLSDAQLQALTA